MQKLVRILQEGWGKFVATSKIKKVLVILGLVVVAALGFRQFSNKEEGPAYVLGQATTGTVSNLISETGEISTTSQVEVTSTINGFISEVYVDNGQEVTRGQKLFYVQSSAAQAERAAAYANYLKAKDALDSAKTTQLTLESNMWKAHETFEADSLDTDLSVDDPIYIQTEREWLAAEQTYISQKDAIAQAQVALSSAWLAYQATIDGPVTAPITGTVANLAVAQGQKVASTDAALLIKGDSETWVELSVSETDISEVHPDQEATITVDALSGLELSGTVKRVDEIGSVSSGIVTYNVYIVVGQPEEGTTAAVLPGMTVQVDIVTSVAENVVVVPNGAIKPYRGGKAVQVVDDSTGGLLYMPVEVGIVGLTETEIVSGIEAGQEIVVSAASSGSGSSQPQGGFLNPGR